VNVRQQVCGVFLPHFIERFRWNGPGRKSARDEDLLVRYAKGGPQGIAFDCHVERPLRDGMRAHGDDQEGAEQGNERKRPDHQR
jgi:hypothetical protein